MNAMHTRPGPVTIRMPNVQPYIIKTLLSAANHKQEKGAAYRSVGLTLTPRATGRAGRNLCPFATKGCARSCFAGFDRLAWPQVKRAAVARTLLISQHPELFRAILSADIARELAHAGRQPLTARLNVVSDVAWEREWPGLFADFPTVQFMDYTKDISRVLDSPRWRRRICSRGGSGRTTSCWPSWRDSDYAASGREGLAMAAGQDSTIRGAHRLTSGPTAREGSFEDMAIAIVGSNPEAWLPRTT